VRCVVCDAVLAGKARRYCSKPCFRTARAASERARRQAAPDVIRAQQRNAKLVKTYGLTDADFERLLAEQGGGCAICRRPETKVRLGVPLPLCVDHDHATGAVRGLLCRACNVGLGAFEDNTAALVAAAAYLRGAP